jgi:hypothetical protein
MITLARSQTAKATMQNARGLLPSCHTSTPFSRCGAEIRDAVREILAIR